MDMIYCGIGFAGFTAVFDSHKVRAVMELGSFLLVFILGLKYLLVKPVILREQTPSEIEKRFHPSSSFMIGMARVLGNPAVLLFWITMAAALTSQHWVHKEPRSKVFCVVGIGSGAAVWFFILSYVVTRLHHQITPTTLRRLSQFSGATLLGLSLVIGYRIVQLLAIR
jgi:threonine/homoserine/homoserine lactone efflux protein